MLRIHFLRMTQGALMVGALLSAQLNADLFEWISTSSDDLNVSTNWDPTLNAPPVSGDDAEFDSSIPNIVLTPMANANFTVDNFEFLNSANAFTFTFNNSKLQLNGVGIIGPSDTTINLDNTDNLTALPYQLNFGSSGSKSTGSASITLTNSGTLTGSGPLSNITFDQVSSIGGTLSIFSNGNISALNTGTDNGSAAASNTVAKIGLDQMEFTDINASNNVVIFVDNVGANNNTSATGGGSSIGYITNCQFLVENITAGDSFGLHAANVGSDDSKGSSNNVGYIGTQQLAIDQTCNVGNNATFSTFNLGSNTGSGHSNMVSYNAGGSDLVFSGPVIAQDNLHIFMIHIGIDGSTGTGNNQVGFSSFDQVDIGSTFNSGNNTRIDVFNAGVNHSTTGIGSSIGFLQNNQIQIEDQFVAGDNFSMSITNLGIDTSTTTTGNRIGYVSGSQVLFQDTCNLGDNANISVFNSGTTSSSTNNKTGYVNFAQFSTDQPFTAGQNLSLTATNEGSATNSNVGFVQVAQMFISDTFTMDNGSVVSAVNSGHVGTQMLFFEGFNVTSGRATIQTTNSGSAGTGINVMGNNSGANVIINLTNSSLKVNTNPSTFSIGGLIGDNTSTAQSTPTLIINTDPDINANFQGTILGSMQLTKTGLGIQQLSGTNASTGLTEIEEGTLNLTGTINHDVQVDALGILMGTGFVKGNVVNAGTIAPGESIGIINFLSTFTNNNGNYNCEVNGAGQSDLISVTNAATLNGGTVIVGTTDGTYKFQSPYTILHANSVGGAYTGAIGVSPLLRPVLSQDAQNVYLTLFSDTQNAADTHNQLEVAIQLDGIVNPNAQQTLLLSQLIDLSIDDAQEALDSLSGYQHTNDFVTSEIINRQFIRRMYDPLRCIVTTQPYCCCDPCYTYCPDDFTTWLEVEGSYTHSNGNKNSHGFNMDGFEVTAGVQKTFCCDWTVGIAGSYETDKLRYKNHGGTDTSNTWFGGAYGLYRPACYYGLVDFAYGSTSHKLKRNIDVDILHFSAHSRPKSRQYTVYSEIGFDWDVGCMLVQPFIGIEGAWFQRNHVSESNANGWGLNVCKKCRSFATARVGMHLTTCCPGCFDASLDIAWNGRLSRNNNKLNENFQQFGKTMDILGIDQNNSIDYALTVSAPIFDLCSVYLEAAGESWRHTYQFNIIGGIKYSW